LASPAEKAGLQKGDVIIGAGGSKVEALETLLKTVKGCGGKKLEIEYKREGKTNKVTVTPVMDKTTGEYRIGVWVRDGTAGIGTVTYIDKETQAFGGLGHGINDSATGILMPFGKGSVVDVTIKGVVKGLKSVPGELKGELGNTEKGYLTGNTDAGVFGVYGRLPEGLCDPVPIGKATEGKATVRSCVSGKVEEYEIQIEEIYKESGKTKNFLIRVTDDKLLAITGGIVQGMSGSPIIQNGCLVGAVTHVLVNDPTRGYGIFIENMMNAAV
jgi:stage IV sporulation protein B